MSTGMGMVKSATRQETNGDAVEGAPPPHHMHSAHLDAPHHQQYPSALLKLGLMLSGVAQQPGNSLPVPVRPPRAGVRPLVALGTWCPQLAAESPRRAQGTPIQSAGKDGTPIPGTPALEDVGGGPGAPHQVIDEKPDLRHNFLLLVGSEIFG